MNIKTLATALVLSTSMFAGSSAFAATMVGSMSVTDEDLPAVQQRCDQLALANTNESLTESSSATKNDTGSAVADSGTSENDSSAGAADATTSSTEQVNEAANSVTKSIDLDTITIEQCRTAGLSPAV